MLKNIWIYRSIDVRNLRLVAEELDTSHTPPPNLPFDFKISNRPINPPPPRSPLQAH